MEEPERAGPLKETGFDLLEVPAGLVFGAMVAPTEAGAVGVARLALGPGDGVVDVAGAGGADAAGVAAGAVADLDVLGECGRRLIGGGGHVHDGAGFGVGAQPPPRGGLGGQLSGGLAGDGADPIHFGGGTVGAEGEGEVDVDRDVVGGA